MGEPRGGFFLERSKITSRRELLSFNHHSKAIVLERWEAEMVKALTPMGTPPVAIRLQPVFDVTEDKFFEFCRLNSDWRIERTAQGEVLIMPPTGGETGSRDAEIITQLRTWARQDGTGVAFGSSTGFDLPNGATRSPDASWVQRSRLEELTTEQKQKFLPLCPDFVIELRSPSDRLDDLREKMREYIDNGAQLGWLLDPNNRRVYVYRPGSPVESLDNPPNISAAPMLPGFKLDLGQTWEPGF
jgi:Uma2 family endonuclease